MSARIDVRKTYKLFIGGAFPRSESGYSYVVDDHKGTFVANAALASRKDARDAVVAARKAFGGWSGRTAYNRAQILYRVAEVMEDRRPQFVQAVQQSEGLSASRAEKVVDAAVDRLVWYAGWADKLTQVVGNANPVAAPVIVSGNTAVVVSSYPRPLPAVNLAEVLATSDLPGGVVNILTGNAATIAPWLASHMDVNAIDLTGIAGDTALASELEVAAADNLKRVRRAPASEPDWTQDPGLEPMTAFLEIKTVWHPMGV